MNVLNIGLIVIAVLDVLMGFIILQRNIKNKINISFACSFFLAGLWALCSSMFREAASKELIIFWGRGVDFSGSMILFSMIFFSFYYPHKSRSISPIEKIFLVISLISLCFIVFSSNIWFGEPYIIDPPNSGYTLKNGYFFFIIYYFVFAFYIITNLLLKFKKNVIQEKKQDFAIIVALTSVLLFSGIFCVLWPAINGSWRFWFWLGPYATLLIFVIVGIILFRRRV